MSDCFWYNARTTSLLRLWVIRTSPPSEREWTALQELFFDAPPHRKALLTPGDYLVHGLFAKSKSPVLTLARAIDYGRLQWLSCEPRTVRRKLGQQGVQIPTGHWHALRGAMLLSELG